MQNVVFKSGGDVTIFKGGPGSGKRPGYGGGSNAPSGGSGKSGKMGTLVKTYSDGTKSYEKTNAKMPAEDAAREIRLMDSVVTAEAAKQLGVSRSDIDLNKETGTLVKWNDTDPSTNGFTVPQKEFYKVEVTGTKVTNVRTDGSKDVYFKDTKFSFVRTGGSF